MKTVLVTGANRGYVQSMCHIDRNQLIDRIGFELTKAYIQKGWRVIAAVRGPSKMPEVDGGEVVIVKLEAGEKEGARKVRHLHLQVSHSCHVDWLGGRGIEEERNHCCRCGHCQCCNSFEP
jgi:NAD(P)-dependent dehydrogenase (short-subunit alcohol dehydrogenase family)